MQSKKQKLLIGVTGGIGTGKTLACEYFGELGCEVYFADDIAKELYSANEELKNELVKQFGEKILDDKGKLSFSEFRKIVFSSDTNQIRVNKIVHPFVISEILDRAKDYPGKLVVIEAALIYESGFDKLIDYTLVVASSVQTRIKRIRKRNKLSEHDIKSIMKLQMPEKEKIAKADFVIKNDSTPSALREKVKFIFSVLNNIK